MPVGYDINRKYNDGTSGVAVKPETLHAHLKMGKGVRPLLLHKTPEEVDKFIHEQLKLREPYYEKAKHIIDINVMDNYDKINAIVQQIRDLLNI